MFVAPSGKTNHTWRAPGLARWFIHDFSSSGGGPELVIHSLPTIGAHSGTSQTADRSCGRAVPACRAPLAPARATSGSRPRDAPGSAREAANASGCRIRNARRNRRPRSLRRLCKHLRRRFRCRGPFRQDVRYGTGQPLPSPVIHDFQSSTAVLRHLVHRVPTAGCARAVDESAGLDLERPAHLVLQDR
jgi:hypothetical protein